MDLDICRLVYNYNHDKRKDSIKSKKILLIRCSLEQEYIIHANKPFLITISNQLI